MTETTAPVLCTQCARPADEEPWSIEIDPLCWACKRLVPVPTGRYATRIHDLLFLVKLTRTNGARRWTTIEVSTPDAYPAWAPVPDTHARKYILDTLREVNLDTAALLYKEYVRKST